MDSAENVAMSSLPHSRNWHGFDTMFAVFGEKKKKEKEKKKKKKGGGKSTHGDLLHLVSIF